VKVDNSIGGITSNVVDYVALREDSSNLRAYMRTLCAVDLATLSPEEKVAMYCNAYNALMIAMIVHFDPPTSVLEISSMVPGGSVWKEKLGTVAGTKVSLDDIEHTFVRNGESAKINGQGLVHACFVCASLSCPDLQTEAFQGGTLKNQLAGAVTRWLHNPTKNPGVLGSQMQLSKIFEWYGNDFVAQSGSIHAFVNTYTSWNVAANTPISFLPYNWALNEVNGTGVTSAALSSWSFYRHGILIALGAAALL
jgi:hypothetical protein